MKTFIESFFFDEERVSKNAATMDGRRQKTVKLHWLKRPKTVIKKKGLYQKKKIIQNLIFGVYLSVLDFRSQQKVAKEITHFTIQFHSKSLTHFTNINSESTLKLMSLLERQH